MRKIIIAAIAGTICSCRQGSEQGSMPVADSTTVKTNDIIQDTCPMVLFKGGTIRIGNDNGTPNERPSHEVTLAPFYLDRNLVTVRQFRNFVNATGYKTDAQSFGDAGVFDMKSKQWALVKGATWERPFGPDGAVAADDHPVTQVSWHDAEAYAKWAGKRLPTEEEWEFAARNGSYDQFRLYPWGKEAKLNGKFMANTWQGSVDEAQGKDGFVYTSPVGYYGETAGGLTDMSGNVWQWCSNTFAPYPGSNVPYRNDETLKVIRGGAFTCDQAGDVSFSVSFRAYNTWETSLFNTGFRCAKDGGK